MVELAQRIHVDFNSSDVISFDHQFESSKLSTISTMHAQDNDHALQRLHDWAKTSKVKPENIKKGTPLLLIHTDISKDDTLKTYPRYVSEIKEAVY